MDLLCWKQWTPASPAGSAGPNEEGGGALRKLLVGEARRRAVQARYYLLEEETEEDGTTYGVQVEMEDEAAAVPDLSPSRERVEDLAAALVRGAVTPVALRDVVDDWLLE